MKLHYIILLLSFIAAGCGTERTVSVQRSSQITQVEQLKKDLNSVLSDPLFIPANISVKVVSLDRGDTLFDHDSKILIHPGSNMKLLTSAAALSALDTGYQFKTSVFIDPDLSGGILNGNIYLKGYGDPDLKTQDLDSLANAVRQSGITLIRGNIVADDSYFDDNYWGAGWTWDDDSDPDAPYINALSVNSNCVRISVLTDSEVIYPLLDPRTEFVSLINRAKVVQDSVSKPLKIRRISLNNPNTILIDGEIIRNGWSNQKISLCRPEYYTGTLFKESLLRAGISVKGNVVNGIIPAGKREIIRHYQPIEKMITYMNKVSDNLSAENILKVLGASMYGVPGTARSGLYVVNRFLSNIGIDTTSLSIADGSGVSRYNLLTAEQIVQLLIAVYRQPRIFPIFYNSLPIAGVDGTLAKRMTTYPAACNLHAKTGNLNGVTCLSGYVLTLDNEMLAFSIMIQNFIQPAVNYHRAQDRIGSILAGFSRKKINQN